MWRVVRLDRGLVFRVVRLIELLPIVWECLPHHSGGDESGKFLSNLLSRSRHLVAVIWLVRECGADDGIFRLILGEETGEGLTRPGRTAIFIEP